jgi:hypothetical protein
MSDTQRTGWRTVAIIVFVAGVIVFAVTSNGTASCASSTGSFVQALDQHVAAQCQVLSFVHWVALIVFLGAAAGFGLTFYRGRPATGPTASTRPSSGRPAAVHACTRCGGPSSVYEMMYLSDGWNDGWRCTDQADCQQRQQLRQS